MFFQRKSFFARSYKVRWRKISSFFSPLFRKGIFKGKRKIGLNVDNQKKKIPNWDKLYMYLFSLFQTIVYMTSYQGRLVISWHHTTWQTVVFPNVRASVRDSSQTMATDAWVLISMTSHRHVDWWRGRTCFGWINTIDRRLFTVYLLDAVKSRVSNCIYALL